MNRHRSVIGAIMRKDFLVFWPAVAVVFALLLLRSDFFVQLMPDVIREWSTGITALACMLLTLGVMHQDASASLRHDWLTKPIPRWSLVAAKLVFIAAVIYLPAIVFDFFHELTRGHSTLEAMLHATALRGDSFAGLVILIIFAAVTSTFLEAAGAFVAVFAVAMIIQVLGRVIGDQAETAFAAGVGWVLLSPLMYLPVLLVAPILWLQYGRRKTLAARSLLAVASVAALTPILLSWDSAFAVQKLSTTDESIARGASVALVPGCFPSIVLDSESIAAPMEERTIPRRTQLAPTLWAPEERSKAGPGAIAFTTSVTPVGHPDGWKMVIGHAQASYVTGDGQVLHRLLGASSPRSWPTGMDASVMASHFWLVPRTVYEDARQRSARMQIEYSVSLLQPVASAELSIGGPRMYFPGLGYCSAQADRAAANIKVDCFKRGEQLALLTAALPDASDGREVPSGYPNYTPAALEALSGVSYRMTLRRPVGSKSLRAKVTAYEARAHFDRKLYAPDLLGGPVNTCAVPSAN